MDDGTGGNCSMSPLAWRSYGERGVLIELGDLASVHALYEVVRVSGLVDECVPGAETLFVQPRDLATSSAVLMRQIEALASLPIVTSARPARMHTVDVIYDGVDLPDVATLTGLSVAEVVRRHAEPTYTVAFLGFSRAFPYLVGLDPVLIVPRLASPRPSVPAGSVGMGAGFTGIYPASTPGGWRLLGRTAEVFFDERREPPSVLAPGDGVRFRAMPS